MKFITGENLKRDRGVGYSFCVLYVCRYGWLSSWLFPSYAMMLILMILIDIPC